MMIVYKSKASDLIKLLFAIAIILLLIFAITEKSWALAAVAAVFSGVVIYIFLETHYTVYENLLTIKSGFLFKETIDIDTIKKISISRKHLLSGPGFSVNRLIIDYNEHDCVIISPDQQSDFLTRLKKINPDIVINER
ncbi:MAG: PH domain-containing protein [Niabella sp.]